MRAREIDMENLKSLSDVYEFLEDHAFDLDRKHDIKDLFVNYRNQTTDGNEKKVAQWDLECFLFNFFGGRVFSFSYANGLEGNEIHQFPSMDKWQTEAFDHVIQRAETVKNPLLKSTYYHLLWKAPKGVKHKKYAGFAIESYFITIDYYLDQYSKDGNEDHFFELTRKFKNLASLVAESRYQLTEVNSLSHRLLFNVAALHFYQVEAVLRTMLEYPTVFKAKAFYGTLDLFENAIKTLSKPSEFHLMAQDLKTAIRIASKIGEDTNKWHEHIGECLVKWAESETESERAWIKQSVLAEAIVSFVQSGNTVRKSEIELMYDQVKENAHLDSGEIPYDPKVIESLKEWDRELEDNANRVLAKPVEEVYEYLAYAVLFPTRDFISKTAFRQEPRLDGINVIKFDINKNIRSLKGKNDDSGEGFWDSYKFQVRHTILPLLGHLFVPGVKSGKLGYGTMIEYLAKNSWIGQTLQKKDLGGKMEKYNWLGIVAPAIIEYFTQLEAALLDPTYRPNFILCTDSLTLKFEGILRDFATKINTGASKGSQTGVQVRYISDLLQDEVMQKNFSDEDRLFLEYLFVNKEGLDLRNNVAHCFYDYNDYHSGQMLLLLVALLRIGRYRFTEQKKDGR